MSKFILYLFYFKLAWDFIHLINRNWGKYHLNNLVYDSLTIIVDLFIIWLILKVNKPQTNPSKFIHFHNAAARAEMKKKYEEAIVLRREGLKLDTLTNAQRAELYFGNGGTYNIYLHDYTKATYCYDKAFELAKDDKFPYDKQYIEVIDAYLKSDRKNDAIKVVEELLKRQSYDKKFKKLKPLRDKLLT